MSQYVLDPSEPRTRDGRITASDPTTFTPRLLSQGFGDQREKLCVAAVMTRPRYVGIGHSTQRFAKNGARHAGHTRTASDKGPPSRVMGWMPSERTVINAGVGTSQCKATEIVVREPDGYTWTTPRNGPCRGYMSLVRSLTGRLCPLHGQLTEGQSP